MTITLDITLIGVAVVYILLSAQIAQSMMQRFISVDYTSWIVILAVILYHTFMMLIMRAGF